MVKTQDAKYNSKKPKGTTTKSSLGAFFECTYVAARNLLYDFCNDARSHSASAFADCKT